MEDVIGDFVALFNAYWYRDFPLVRTHKEEASRAEWTTHIGVCVKACADLMGYFTCFEQGNRTDAIVKDREGKHVAHIEWEFVQPFRPGFNEARKLAKLRKRVRPRFSALVIYTTDKSYRENVDIVASQWGKTDHPLILFLITFDFKSKHRRLRDLETHIFLNGKIKKLRAQKALPWNVKGTRWEHVG